MRFKSEGGAKGVESIGVHPASLAARVGRVSGAARLHACMLEQKQWKKAFGKVRKGMSTLGIVFL